MSITSLFRIKATPNRDSSLDFLKLFGMIYVVFHHCFQLFFVNSVETYFCNIFFSFVMAMFFFMSGFVMKVTSDKKSSTLLKTIIKRAFSLLMPILMFAIIYFVTAWIKEGTPNLGLFALIFYEDPSGLGLWFLHSLFFMSVIMTVIIFLVNLIPLKHKLLRIILICFFYLLIVGAIFFSIYRFVNPSFLNSKLVLYYSAFFVSGFAFGNIKREYRLMLHPIPKYIIGGLSLGLFVFLLIRYMPIMTMEDDIKGLIIRLLLAFSAIYVCFVVSGLLTRFKAIQKISAFGQLSLELYAIHILIISAFLTSFPKIESAYLFPNNLLVIPISLGLIIVSVLVIFVIKTNFVTDFIFFGKTPFLFKKKVEKVNEVEETVDRVS